MCDAGRGGLLVLGEETSTLELMDASTHVRLQTYETPEQIGRMSTMSDDYVFSLPRLLSSQTATTPRQSTLRRGSRGFLLEGRKERCRLTRI